VIKKLYHWEYILLMGLRYGYLGWRKYPVRHPRGRVAVLSVAALPLAKFRTALQWVTKRPAAALKLAGFGLVESLGALVITPCRGHSSEILMTASHDGDTSISEISLCHRHPSPF
jgi:hypothetical protein